MRACILSLFLALAALPGAWASDRDAAFAKIPFERWLGEHDQAHFRWHLRVDSVELANFQRLRARVEVALDGKELVKRQGAGEFAFFLQFRDASGGVYQTHGSIGLRDVKEGAAQSNFVYTQDALVLPGDYRVEVALLDTHTGEHATQEKNLHVAPLRNDPFPDSWRDLPPVALLDSATDAPDAWFHPETPGILRLPVETRNAVRLDVLLNIWPVPEAPRRRAPQATNRSLADLLPALKVLSQLQISNGTLGVSVLDLSRRKTVFSENGLNPQTQPLDWERLRPALLQADPNTINVSDLAGAGHNAQFLLAQVRRRIEDEKSSALILLSAPLEFAGGEDLQPIELSGRPTAPVFLFRFHTARMLSARLMTPRGMAGPGQMPRIWRGPRALPSLSDQLEPLLKPVHPRVFDIYTPQDFRKALAEVLHEVARL